MWKARERPVGKSQGRPAGAAPTALGHGGATTWERHEEAGRSQLTPSCPQTLPFLSLPTPGLAGQAQVSLTASRMDLLQVPSRAGSQRTESGLLHWGVRMPTTRTRNHDTNISRTRNGGLALAQHTPTHPHTHSWGLAGTVGSPSGSRGGGGRGYLSPVTNAQRHSETYNWDPTKTRLAQNTHTPPTSRHSSTAHAGTARRTGVPWLGGRSAPSISWRQAAGGF